MSVDVVIPSAAPGDLLDCCLRSLERQTLGHEVIVVGNGWDADDVASWQSRRPRMRFLHVPRNLGFGRAVNLGAAAGRGATIVLLNDDMEVELDFLEQLVAPLADAAVGMVAGLMLVPDSPLVDCFGIELDVTLAAYNRLRHRLPGDVPGRLAVPSGGAVAYRRGAFEQAGGFDPRLPAYGEDVDLGLRLRLAGWVVAEASAARGTHLGGATLGRDERHRRAVSGLARGFLLRRYGVLRGRHGARALLFEALVVGWGVAHHRTLMPLRSRLRGWRAAGSQRLAVPPGAVDQSITMREAWRRLRA